VNRITRYLLLFFALLVLGKIMDAQDRVPKVLTISGPNALSLRFTDPLEGLYRHAEILKAGQKPVPLDLSSDDPSEVMLVDGLDANGRNGLFKFKLRKDLPWSLRVWSLDGRYVVLVTYTLRNGHIDIRNERYTNAYDTQTGKPVVFSGKSKYLSNDSFEQWSPTKPDVAILFTGSNPPKEEAFPQKD